MPNGNFKRGAERSEWVGDNGTYRTFHSRVVRTRGPAKNCVFKCSQQKKYEWANLTGHYENIRDYIPLCTSCHSRYDDARKSMEPNVVTLCRSKINKLNEEIVRECRIRNAAGEPIKKLAQEFDVTFEPMRQAIRGITWRWIDGIH